jgi:phenylalanyl-tRNA synthetase beta chain
VGNPEKFLKELFRSAKGTLEAMPRYVHIEPLSFEKNAKPLWADDILWFNIIHGGAQVGNMGLLSKKAALDCGIKNSAVMLFELDIDSLKPLNSRSNTFVHLPEYPMTDYDISLLFDSTTKWEEIAEVTKGKDSPDNLLRSVSFVDEYRGKQVPEGKKSVTLRLVIGSQKKTLTSDEIENCAGAVIKRLSKALGAELRG